MLVQRCSKEIVGICRVCMQIKDDENNSYQTANDITWYNNDITITWYNHVVPRSYSGREIWLLHPLHSSMLNRCAHHLPAVSAQSCVFILWVMISHILSHIITHIIIYYHILATPLSKLYCRCTTLQTNLNHCTDLCSWTLPFGDLGDVAATAQISVILIPAIIAIIAIPCLELEKPREKRIFKFWPFFRGSLTTRSNNDLSEPRNESFGIDT